jgi:hypothetical protein
MPRIFFSYYLADAGATEEFLRRIASEVAHAARGEESVLGWSLHRTVDWPGSSDQRPDFVCVVDITDLRAWSTGAAESIVATHSGLGGLVKRIAMTVTADAAA